MNRFRTKKKGKDELDAPRPSIESESSSPFRMFGKKKAPEEEPKKELDLATALPSTDDFRTSLLMTNLSARFSMLREQDDPNTKLGKASDDSVLFPNRQSRMMDFGFAAGLGDIAEVESVKAPFARSSVLSNDDTSSLNGSVMGRSKPIEGNNLFGGRQKVYKIGAGGNKGAMSGRVLYGDDVAQSAFQKWRQSEKDRQSFDDLQQSESLESEIERPESPSQIDYNRKRETNSTTSSGPYAARDSTAATSVSSSQKDRESFANTFRTASPTPTAPTVERTVTRTRRLYEQSLNQDQQDHQTSALSRFDTLSKRTIGSRTPDLTPPVPSPSSATFGDRFITRSVLGKASAPNLRSFSPSSESVNKFPNMDQKAFGATPPLSPPISETGEVQPLDRNMILSRNNSQYDESRFAQRQVQMQRGRETPTTGFRNDSNTSLSGPRSRSPSAQRTAAEKSDSGSFPTVQEESQSSTFFDDDDDEDEIRSPDIITPQLTVEKPADIEHPALRHSAMPTPLIISDGPGDIASAKVNDLPHDSPTLGPTSGGLSGMVRQHLRSDSNASSIYGSMPNDADLSSRFPPERPDAHAFEPKTMDSNAWESIERDLAMSIDGSVTSPTRSSGLVEAQIMSSPEPVQEFRQDTRPQQQDETDEFARHLADGARRVRERLTSFVESDSGATVPQAPLSELPPPPRPNALGILKSKPSIGSMERGRGDREAVNQSKTKKLLGLRGSSPASAKVSPTRDTFDDRMPQSPEGMNDADTPRDSEEKEGVHAGLKAFRQARRDLQRMKELELQQRRQGPQSPPTGRDRAQTATSSRAPSQERSRPPPVSYNRMPSEEAGANGGSRAGSRAGSRSGSRAPSERDRSGSEASSGGRSGSRPPRVRAGSSAHDDYQGPLGSPVGVNAKHRQGPMIRSPMMPGQEMRRSPHPQSQQPYPGNASSGRFGRSENSLHIHPAHGYDLGQPSPISPCAPSPKGFASHGPGPQRPYGPGGMMRNRDMSEPSIKSSGSPMGYPRSGPAPLNGGTVSTPNLHGNVGAPPLPPINPRRKNTGVALGDATMNAHHLPSSPGIPIDQRGLRGEEDEGIGHYRQRLRKATSEANVNARARSMLQNPAPPMVPPPMPPSTSSNALPGGMI